MTGSAPRDRNAIPRAHVMITGKANTQNTASGSRTNSRKRDSVSSTSGFGRASVDRNRWIVVRESVDRNPSLIAQLPSGQGHEHVFESGAVGAEPAQLGVALPKKVVQGRHRQVQFGGRQMLLDVVPPHFADTGQPAE